MMRAKVNTKELAAALKTVSAAITRHGSLPVLGGVRMEVTAKTLALTASNIDLTITTTIPCEGTKGVLIPPAALLGKLIGSVGTESCEIRSDGDDATITGGSMVASIRAFGAEAWPKIQTASGDSYTLDSGQLADIARIAGFVSVDTSKAAMLLGVHLKGNRAQATDSYRYGAALLGDIDLPNVIVPADTIRAVLASAADGVTLTVEGTHVTFRSDTTTWTTGALPGDYPDVSGIYAQDRPNEATFPRAELAEAVKRVASIETSGTPVVTLEIGGDRVRLSNAVADVGTIEDVADCKGDLGSPFRFNAGFLVELLAAAEGVDEVTFLADTTARAVIVKTPTIEQFLMPIPVHALAAVA